MIKDVGVEKVTEISRMRFSRSMLEGSDPAHALLDSHRRRPADHDGAKRPLRSAVLLLPPGRSSSRGASAAAHRKAHQLCFRAGEAESELQRYRPAVD